MMQKSFVFIFALLSCITTMASDHITVNTKTVGPVSISCSDANGWIIETGTEMVGEQRECVSIHISRSDQAVPPMLTVSFEVPLIDMYHEWQCCGTNERFPIRPEWGNNTESQIARDMPLTALFNDDNTNRLTMACDEAYRKISFKSGIKEEGCKFQFRMNLFTSEEAPISDYSCHLLLDARQVFWSKAIEDASAWIMESASIKPFNVPSAAFEPLYSSWYQFHKEVSAHAIEAECRLASQMGMKTVILDDGWQTDDNHHGYAFCGDWQISRNKFPDMKAHVDAVHKMGMKYMVWYSVPYIGKNSEAYARFKGKYLYGDSSKSVLDPRFPEVREYLVGVYETAMKEWGLDGFKLDFIDKFTFRDADPALADNYAGRDIKSLTEAVDVLMKTITERLTAINPDVLIEFRQRYVGPAIRKYGNMFRCADCPGDYFSNRIRSANLRLTSGSTAVHSDMLEWNMGESTQTAARQILSSIFATIQYSMMLRDISPEHRKLIAHWISFTQKHKNTLLHGEFLPYDPKMCYPVIEARTDEEQIVTLYQSGKSVNLGTKAPVSYLINASTAKDVITFFDRVPRKIRLFNTLGEEMPFGVKCKKLSAGKPNILEIPVCGYAEIVW